MSLRKPRRVDWAMVFIYLLFLELFLYTSPQDEPFLEGARIIMMMVFGFPALIALIEVLSGWWTKRNLLNDIWNLKADDSVIGSEASNRPPYSMIDSLDREMLDCLNRTKGDVVRTKQALDDEGLITERQELRQRLTKLFLLGLVRIPPEESRLVPTARGLDALNLPASLFISRIPTNLWNQVLSHKIALFEGKWNRVAVILSQLLENVLKDIIHPKILLDTDGWDKIRISKYQGKKMEDLTIGQLQGAARDLEVLKKGTFDDWLVSELKELRKSMAHAKSKDDSVKTLTAEQASTVDLYLDILLKLFYGHQ